VIGNGKIVASGSKEELLAAAGTLVRSTSPRDLAHAAIMGYFVVSLVLPGILVLLAQVRSWFADLQPWIAWNETQIAPVGDSLLVHP
jgi:hypothetical protein